MPSSTSNSDPTSPGDRAPLIAWRCMWSVAAILTLALLGNLEAFWRSRGHEPCVTDCIQLWADHRGKVYDGGEETVVLLGKSRMQTNFSTETFRDRFPNRQVVQLSVAGKDPIATLSDLSRDENFSAIVICSITAMGVSRESWSDQRAYVEYYHDRWTLNEQVNQQIECYFQQHFTLLNPQINARTTLRKLLSDLELPKPQYVITFADRSQDRLSTRMDLNRRRRNYLKDMRRRYEETTLDVDEWLEDAAAIELMVQIIHRRGGTVAFVRMPVAQELYRLDEEFFPREKYWDRFAEIVSSETIHFQDVPALRKFDMPDLSHIDHTDKARFTTALIGELLKRRVLEPK